MYYALQKVEGILQVRYQLMVSIIGCRRKWVREGECQRRLKCSVFIIPS